MRSLASAAADHRGGGLRPGAARPGRAVPAAQRGASGRQPRLRVRRGLRRSASSPSWSSCAAGCWTSWTTICAGPSRGAAGGQAGERRGAHPRPPRRRSPIEVDAVRPRRPGHLVRGARHRGQGGHRAVGARHPQGHRDRRAAHARCRRERGALPRRRRHRRERLPPSAGPDVGIKVGPGETAAGFRVDDPLEAVRVLALLLETRRQLALRRAGGADRAALDARQRPDRRPWSPRTPRSPGCATRARTPRRSSPTCSAARPRASSRSRPHGTACPARPALPPGHDDRGDPLVRPDRHRLARRLRQPPPPTTATATATRWSAC